MRRAPIRVLLLACLGAVLAVGLAACADNDFGPGAVAPAAAPLAGYRLATVEVDFAPDAEIEWCEDDLWRCDEPERRIAETFETGVRDGARDLLTGDRPARLEVTVAEFDSITLLSRITTGGVHYVGADFRLVDGDTGAVLAERAGLDFDLVALGRAAALIANLRGRTQRVRIAERIANVTRAWLAAANSAEG